MGDGTQGVSGAVGLGYDPDDKRNRHITHYGLRLEAIPYVRLEISSWNKIFYIPT